MPWRASDWGGGRPGPAGPPGPEGPQGPAGPSPFAVDTAADPIALTGSDYSPIWESTAIPEGQAARIRGFFVLHVHGQSPPLVASVEVHGLAYRQDGQAAAVAGPPAITSITTFRGWNVRLAVTGSNTVRIEVRKTNGTFALSRCRQQIAITIEEVE